VLGELDIHMQRNETGPLAYIMHKINSRWIMDLNLRPETIKSLEESSLTLVLAMIFFEMTTKAKATKPKIDKWDYLNQKASAQERKQSTK